MRSESDTSVFDDWGQEQKHNTRLRFVSLGVGMIVLGFCALPAMIVGERIATGFDGRLVSAALLVLFLSPVGILMVLITDREQRKTDAKVGSLAADLADAVRTAALEAKEREKQAQRQQFESQLANALDMADGEPEVIDVIERSLIAILPQHPVELLLADNSHAHLQRMASASPVETPFGCSVDSPDRCPAARRAQVQHFLDSDVLDACPKLRERPEGRISALCVPVSIMGRTVGVIHGSGQPDRPFAEDTVDDLGILAKLAGARIGLLRVMAETQLQASTDSLTGLMNRRTFETKASAALKEADHCAIAMGDLDEFKVVNDTYGHETGDRALRLFAQVLRESLRSMDLICRYGGEEFALAFPACTAAQAKVALDAVRSRLEAAITIASVPKFSVSFGVVDASGAEDLLTALNRADGALLEAKSQGRDRVISRPLALSGLAGNDDDKSTVSVTSSNIADQFRREIR